MAKAQLLWREKFKTLYLPPDKHKDLRLAAVSQGKTLLALTEEIVDEYLSTRPEPRLFDLIGKVSQPSDTSAAN